jgi:grpE
MCKENQNEMVNEETLEEQEVEVVEEENTKTQDNPLEAELESLNKRYMLLLADFDNFKRRTQVEKAQIYELGNEALIKSLLPGLDAFDMAFKALPENLEEPLKSFAVGMEAVYKKFRDSLEANGVTEIEALGKIYDPVYHEAVMTVEDSSVENDTIIDVLQKGYQLKDKVIRPSVCRVAKN